MALGLGKPKGHEGLAFLLGMALQGSIAEFLENHRGMRHPARKKREPFPNFTMVFPPCNAKMTSELSSDQVRKKSLRDEPASSDRDFS
jgi:hypothetical protein